MVYLAKFLRNMGYIVSHSIVDDYAFITIHPKGKGKIIK